jgi:hypothetical protein
VRSLGLGLPLSCCCSLSGMDAHYGAGLDC